MNKEQVLDKLKTINYPGFNRDIVSFGLVRECTINAKGIITIGLSFNNL